MVAFGQKMCYNIGNKELRYCFHMFFGEFNHQIDDNNRIRIPTQVKNELGSTFYMAKGLDGVINVLPASFVAAQIDKLQSCISEFDEDEQEALLEYTSSVFEVAEDKHGRVRIPDILVEFAGLEKDIVTVGIGNKLSIMSKEVRESKRNKRTHSENMGILNKKIKG